MPTWDMTKQPTVVHRVRTVPASIQQYLGQLKERIYTPIASLKAEAAVTREPVPFQDRKLGHFREYAVGDAWGELFDCAWFHLTGQVPESARGQKVVLRIDIGGEGCIFDEAGCPVRGITNVASDFDLSLGMPGKRIVPFLDCAQGGEEVDLWLDGACNDLFGKLRDGGRIATLDIALCRDKVRDLYYDMSVLSDLLSCMDGQEPQYFAILYSLQKAIACLRDFTDEELDAARVYTRRELSRKGGDTCLAFDAVGHAHIDLAWLWPLRETRRKGARTFSTQLEMLDRYPGYVFGASQAQLYDWIRTDYPLLYEKVKEAVRAGRWEVQGGAWVESDTNVPSGESLTRQFLYGKRFFRQEFGLDMKMLWLPDVFGYSAALPQIIKKSGCDYFSTIKLSWSLINKFPYHTFRWAGLDGSQVLVHMPPEGSYNSAALPSSVAKAADSYQEKGLCDRALIPFGIGDGGGGPGAEHLERLIREENLAGSHPVRMGKAIDFFEAIAPAQESYPSWKGELYVERHQGTLTTQARNKLYNRRLEKALHDAELICTLAWLKSGAAYPRAELERIWKEVLLYQFHDILPGSSIKRVYDESVPRYQALEREALALRDAALASLGDGEAGLFNTLPWKRTLLTEREGRLMQVEAEPFSFAPLSQAVPLADEAAGDDTFLENDRVRLVFGEDGAIASFLDKASGRELVKPGQALNRLRVFTDVGDAWDFSYDYRQRKSDVFRLERTETLQSPGLVVRRSVYRHGASVLTQEISLRAGSALADFRTTVEWQERDRMLRAEFPLDLDTDFADCDIQFGHIRRSTQENSSQEYAQIEFAAHKWLDLSEADWGVALLNDCKYGHYVKDGLLSLNLLRSQNNPGVGADLGRHEFRYALYPHGGNLAASDVQKTAYEYNYPAVPGSCGTVPGLASVEEGSILLETVKAAEDGDGVILRFYEYKGSRCTGRIRLDSRFARCVLTNLIEDEEQELPVGADGVAALSFRPFEVHTLKLAEKQ